MNILPKDFVDEATAKSQMTPLIKGYLRLGAQFGKGVFIDKPFKIGDTIKTSSFEGAVQEVGFRSTRIKTADESIVYISNARLSEMTIDNKGFKIFKTPYGTIGTLICYDQWFPEGARILAAQGAQIIFYPTAIGWPTDNPKWKKQAEHQAWQITQRSHGIDNNIFIASVNRIGREKDIRFWGSSFVSDPFGRIICQAPVDKEELLIADIDYSVTDNMREEWPFLQERRIKTENAQTT
jgi:predicted amidohydrolase